MSKPTAADRLAEIQDRHTSVCNLSPWDTFDEYGKYFIDAHHHRAELLSMVDDLKAELEQVKERRNRYADALESLADDEWWDMETPSTAADFARAALKEQDND